MTTELLDSGLRPVLKGNRLVLGKLVLVRADGEETKYADEVRSAGVEVNFWERGTERRGNRVYGKDIAGNRYMLSHMKNGERVVTKKGRRFYNEAPTTEWIIHLPIANRRGEKTFDPRWHDLTPEIMENLFQANSPEYQLLTRTTSTDEPERMMQEWQRLFPPGMVLPQDWEYKDKDPDVDIVVDDRALSYSLHKTGRGGRTVDTVLDRVVFGEPVTPFDLYQRNKLFETSRRRNGECGLDVIVCGQTMTADQAAETLVALAKQHFPDSDLANSAWTAPGVSVALEIRNRNVDSAPLRQFVPRLKDYCSNGRSIRYLKLALQKQKVFRKRARADRTAEEPSFLQTLMEVVNWSLDLEHRLMVFFALFPKDFIVDGDNVTSTMQPAREAIQKHGTPVRLLTMFYQKLGVRLVIYHGSLCRYVHTPQNWDQMGHRKNTVVLNIWGNHVFTYQNSVVHGAWKTTEESDEGQYRISPPRAFYEHQLAWLGTKDRCHVADMKPWRGEYKKGYYYVTEPLDAVFMAGIDREFHPMWKSCTECTRISIKCGSEWANIKRLPHNYEALMRFCERARGLNVAMTYCGESAGMLCYEFVKNVMRLHKEPIGGAHAALMERQQNRCGGCGDVLKRSEVHHKKARYNGGTDDIDNLVLLCPMCHATETERQEQAGNRSSVYLESHLSPVMYSMFAETPCPRHIIWGDNERQAEARQRGTEEVTCLDVVGCRLNCFMERTRPLPIGCPLDRLEPVTRSLWEYEWLWVDAFAEGGQGYQHQPDQHRCYDGPHLYPLETVLFLIEDGFLEPSESTLPWGWAPSHTRPAADLHDAIRMAQSISEEPKHMVLSMLGLWNVQRRENIVAYRTDNDDDVPGPISIKHFGDMDLIFTTTRLHDTRTMLPLALQCRFSECLRMEKAIRLLERVPKIIPLAARVDGIYWTSQCEESKRRLVELADEHRYSISRRNVYCMKRCNIDSLPVNEQSFTHKVAPLLRVPEWRCGSGCIDEIVSNGGALVTGAAGTGKSTLLRALKERLEKHVVCSYTHATARLVGGVTVQSLLHKTNYFQDRWVLVDECSLIPIDTLGLLARATLVGAKFVLFGDFDGQFGAMQDRWDVPYSEVPNSELIRDMTKSLWVKLETYRRGEDPELFGFYHGLYGQDVRAVIASARAKYPVTMKLEEHDMILCVSHNRRMTLNRHVNRLSGGLLVKCDETIKATTCQPQDMYLKPGLQLIGCPRGVVSKRGVVQGVMYTVLEVGPEVSIRMNDEYQSEGPVEMKLPLAEVPLLLRLTHAMCYFTIQGRTLRDKHILLADTHNEHFTIRSLIVGMSRATHGKYVHVL